MNALEINGNWYVPIGAVYVIPMSCADEKMEKNKMAAQRVVEKALLAGMTPEEIETLRKV